MGGRHSVAAGENLLDLARAHGLGYVEMLAANPGTDPWLPRPGEEVVLPVAHLPPAALEPGRLVVNLGDMRLYWGDASFPVGIGRDGWAVRPLATTVVGKRTDPTWVPPASIRAEKPWLPSRVPPGPDNPLGTHSLDLGTGLLRIHGTNRPDGVGRRVSHGCVRLYPEDIVRLFPLIPVGTPVVFVDEPVKVARIDGEIWLEAHPPPPMADALEYGRASPPTESTVEPRVAELAGPDLARVDWALVRWAERSRMGVPVRVTRPSAPPPMVLDPGQMSGG